MSDETSAVSTIPPPPAELGLMSQADTDAMYSGIMDNVDMKAEVSISRMQLVQPGTPEINTSKGYEAGQIMDGKSKTVRSYKLPQPWLDGKVPLPERELVWCMPFLCIGKLPTEFVKWVPKEQRDVDPTLPKIEWKTLDKNDPRVREGTTVKRGGTWWHASRPETTGKRPPVTDAINFGILPLTPDYQLNCSFRIGTFSRTSAPAGQTLATNLVELKVLQRVPWYFVQWLYTKKVPDPKHNSVYYIYQVADGIPLNKANPSLFATAETFFKSIFVGPNAKQIQAEFLQITEGDLDDSGEEETEHSGTTVEPVAKAAPTGGVDPF